MTILRTLAYVLLLSANALAAAPALLESSIEKALPASEALYLDLHQNPELSFHETRTAAKIADHLRSLGYEVTTGVGRTGVVAVLKNGSGPTVMLRTELDALPIEEQTGVAYASKAKTLNDVGLEVPVMQACGHDLHMASLVGTATVMAQNRQVWHGTLMLVGQPAEETISGAEAMLKDGLFTRFPKPDIALAIHDTEMLPAGDVGFTSGFALTSADSVDVVFYGRGAHGSRPHMAVDPIVIASRAVLAWQTIVSREVEPGNLAVITVGSFHAGTKNNIIPDEAHLQLTVRAYKPEIRKQVLASIERIAKGEALAAGAPREPLVKIYESTLATYNDPEITNRLAKVLAGTLGAGRVKEMPPDFPSEDFSRYQEAGAKTVMLRIGATNPERFAAAQKTGAVLPGLHTPRFVPDLKPSLRTGIETEVLSLTELMGNK
jgi:hippurate hydrolase